MTTCDDILDTIVLGAPLEGEAAQHVRDCPRCHARAPLANTVSLALTADARPEPPRLLAARVLRAAAPLLERNAQRAARRSLARAIAAALVPLPAILLADAYLLRRVYDLLSAVLPATLSLYLVANYAGVLALLLALTYGAIPFLVEQQARLQRRMIHD